MDDYNIPTCGEDSTCVGGVVSCLSQAKILVDFVWL